MKNNLDEKNLLAFFKCMSNATRYHIFLKLFDGVRCNCEISKELGISLSLVSHHIRVLEELQLIRSTRDEDDGRWIYYSLNPDMLEKYRHQVAMLLDPSSIAVRAPLCGKMKGILEKTTKEYF